MICKESVWKWFNEKNLRHAFATVSFKLCTYQLVTADSFLKFSIVSAPYLYQLVSSFREQINKPSKIDLLRPFIALKKIIAHFFLYAKNLLRHHQGYLVITFLLIHLGFF